MTSVPYRIRRSPRARVARINVSPEGVEVVVPRRFPEREVEPFVREKSAWIERTLRRFAESERELPPPVLRDGGEVPYLGERLGLEVRVESGRQRPHVKRVRRAGPDGAGPDGAGLAHALQVRLPTGGSLREALESWYRRQARAEIAPRLDAACAAAGRSYKRLTIRGQRTRWASCSTSGTMSFNWRLLLAPEEILDYVVEHEVAHLEVPDHSERFWALLGSRWPGWRGHEAWLRRHGHALRL